MAESQAPEDLVTLVRQSKQVIGLHTIIRNAECSREARLVHHLCS